MTRALTAIPFLLLTMVPLRAQDAPRPGRFPLGSTLLSLPSSRIPSQGSWEVKFTHRFNQSLSDGTLADQWHALFGLDSNADVVFGASWIVRPDLELSLARSNTNDTIEGAAKYVVLEQSAGAPLTFAARGGAYVRTERDLGDRQSLFVQAIVSRQVGEKLELFALPTFVTNGGRAVSGDRSQAMFEHAFNVPLAAAYMIRPRLAAVVELIPPNGDIPEGVESDFGWSIGIKRALGGHWFEVLLTNSQSTMADQYVTTTFQGAGLDAGDVKLGFNIERRFGRR